MMLLAVLPIVAFGQIMLTMVVMVAIAIAAFWLYDRGQRP